jgi:hypothetical protein
MIIISNFCRRVGAYAISSSQPPTGLSKYLVMHPTMIHLFAFFGKYLVMHPTMIRES